MRLALSLLALAAAAVTAASAQTPASPTPPPPPEGRIHVVAYVETRPDWTAKALDALRAYRDATRVVPGSVDIAAYEEISRPNRFLVDEIWRDAAAWDAHARGGRLANALAAGHLAPPDVRAHTEWSMGAAGAPNRASLYAFTHIDVSPPQLAGLQALLTPYLEKSRNDKGVARFDLLQGLAPRRNHQTLAEAWATEAAFRAHQASAHAIEFRDRLGPLLGALYDQRLYRLAR